MQNAPNYNLFKIKMTINNDPDGISKSKIMNKINFTKVVKNLLTTVVILAAVSISAQDEAENELLISGSIDTYYQTNLSASDDIAQSFGTSFADELGFALGMANLIVSYEGEKTGVVADVVFGPRGDAAVGGYNLNQLYAFWNVSENIILTGGRFNTYLGYEVISPVGNFNYSTSYLFSSGPFSHVGVKADFTLSEDFSLMLAFMNVTDTNNNLSGAYSAGAQLGYAGQFLNLYYDDGEVLGFEIDYTGGFDLSSSFFLGINAAYADNDGEGFTGAALYPQVEVSEAFSLGLRGEYFETRSELVSENPNVFATTLTGSFSVENLVIKPEIRLDSLGSDSEPYFDADGMASKSLSSFLVAAIYSF